MSFEKSGEGAAGSGRFFLKKIGKEQWLALVLLGLLLVVIAMPTAKSGQKERGDMPLYTAEAEELTSTDLERQLAGLLEQVEGVGKVEVMICSDSGRESLLSSESGRTGAVSGALIVAEGADDPETVQKIREAVKALFQIEAHKIEVMKMK